MQDLRGKVAVVTGAGSGIGRALAEQLVKEGCALALADINAETLHSLAAELKSSGVRVTTHVLDVAKRAAVYAFADEVLSWSSVNLTGRVRQYREASSSTGYLHGG